MSKDDYSTQLVKKCHLETNAYEQVDINIDSTVYKKLQDLCSTHQNCLTENERRAILSDDWQTSNLYVLPKINKCKPVLEEIKRQQKPYIKMPMPSDLSSRPIVSGPKSVTKGLSRLLERILTPLVEQIRSYIKDERDFLRKFPNNIDKNSHIICCDVVSLYTSIPNTLGLQAIDHWTSKLSSLIPSRFTKNFILEGTKFVLENNYFAFNGTMWHQIVGTAMGKEVASPYACLTVGFLEETRLFPTILPLTYGPELSKVIEESFFRFVDDGINAIPNSIDDEHFQGTLNSMDPSIQFTVTRPSATKLNGRSAELNNFLSLKVYKTSTGKIVTDVYYKETNTHEYLHFDSHHPSHIKNNIPYCLAKTIIVSTSDEKMMEKTYQT